MNKALKYTLVTSGLLTLAAHSAVFATVRTYAADNNIRVYDLDDQGTGSTSTSASVSRAAFQWTDQREAYGSAQAGASLLTSSVTVEGESGIGVQIGATAATVSSSVYKPEDLSQPAGETIDVDLNFSYHGTLDIPNVGPTVDSGWNRGEATFIFSVYDRVSATEDIQPVVTFYAPFHLNSSGVGLTLDPNNLSIRDGGGAVLGTANLNVTDHGANKVEFAVDGIASFFALNQQNLKVEFEVSVLAAASNTTLTHKASFDNTASYTLTSSNPNAEFSLVPEPGSVTLLGLSGLFAITRRLRKK